VSTASYNDNETSDQRLNGSSQQQGAVAFESVDSTHQSHIKVRAPVITRDMYTESPVITSVDKDMRMDFSRMIGKPFHVGTLTWTTAQAVANPVGFFSFPSALVSLNTLASAPFDLASLYHVKACAIVQVAGTPMHSGALIAAAVSANTTYSSGSQGIQSLQCAPHVFLHANNSTSACVELPWYSNTKLRQTPGQNNNLDLVVLDSDNRGFPDDYVSLEFFVMSPLGAPSTGATSLVVTVSIVFKEMDFFVPKATYPAMTAHSLVVSLPGHLQAAASLATLVRYLWRCYKSSRRSSDAYTAHSATKAIDGLFSVGKRFVSDSLDSARGWIRSYTGLHNPNERNPSMRGVMALRNNPNYVDQKTFMYKMDPYASYSQPFDEYYSDTKEDEGLISHLVSKDMYVGRLSVDTSVTTGTVLFTAPIHPLMFRANTANSQLVVAPIDKLSRLSRYYSGTLRLRFQNCGSSFHMFKLLVVREYYSAGAMLTTVPPMANMLNNPADILEFSAGGQTATVDLPMASIFDMVPITSDPTTNCLTHGRVIVYLLQPLVTNGAVTTSCDVLVHLSALPDFTLYGYACDQFVNTFSLPALGVQTAAAKNPDLVIRSNTDWRPVKAKIGNDQLDGLYIPKGITPLIAQDYGLAYSRFLKAYYPVDISKIKARRCEAPDLRYARVALNSDDGFVAHSASAPMVLSSDQELVEHDSTPGPKPTTYLRPIVHIRDHIRRMLPVQPFVVPAATTTGQKATFYIDVASLIFASKTASSLMTTMQFISSMYLGYRGGLKIKLAVRGASDVKGSYVPASPVIQSMLGAPNPYRYGAAEPSATNTTVQGNLYSRFAYVDPSFSNRSLGAYQGPFLDSSDWNQHSSAFDKFGWSATGPVSTDILTGTSMLEFEIPYMSVLRFIGMGNGYTPNFYMGSLGWIILGYASQYNTDYDSGSETPPNVVIAPYVGADDSRRFVYQALSNPCSVNWVTATPTNVQDTFFQGPITDIPASIPASLLTTFFVGIGSY